MPLTAEERAAIGMHEYLTCNGDCEILDQLHRRKERGEFAGIPGGSYRVGPIKMFRRMKEEEVA